MAKVVYCDECSLLTFKKMIIVIPLALLFLVLFASTRGACYYGTAYRAGKYGDYIYHKSGTHVIVIPYPD